MTGFLMFVQYSYLGRFCSYHSIILLIAQTPPDANIPSKKQDIMELVE